MAKINGKSSIFDSPWATLARVVFTAVFFFWLYWIGTSTKDLDDKINASADRYTTIDSLQIEYKDEVQAWKDLLLRSNNRDALNQNWLVYEAKFQKVAAATQDIISHNELRSIDQKMRSFLDAHTVNHEKYKNSTLLLVDSRYSPGPADTSVKGIDRPLLDIPQVSQRRYAGREKKGQ